MFPLVTKIRGVRVVWLGVQLLLLLVREAEQCVARGL